MMGTGIGHWETHGTRRPRIAALVLAATCLVHAGAAAAPGDLPSFLPSRSWILPTGPLSRDAFDRMHEESLSRPFTVQQPDGVYGRFTGTVTFVPEIGVAREHSSWAPLFGVRAYYLSSIGLVADYADGRVWPFDRPSKHAVTDIALEARPLFLIRWPENWEQGPSWLDLTVDSFSLGLGGFWDRNTDTEADRRGPEALVGVGVPLLGYALGPWLSGQSTFRWGDVGSRPGDIDVVWSVRLQWVFATDTSSQK